MCLYRRSVNGILTASHKMFPSINPAKSAPSPLFWLERLCACGLAHVGDKQTNGDEMTMKREVLDSERQLTNEHISSTHSLNQIIPPPLSFYFCSCHLLHATLPFFLPSSLCCCEIIDPPRGTVGCCRGNRCLITVLIAGHRQTRTHFYSGKQWQK